MLTRLALVLSCSLLLAAPAFGQTPVPTPSSPTSPTPPTTSTSDGAYAKLSPGNQKIVNAIFAAQKPATTTTTTTTTAPGGTSTPASGSTATTSGGTPPTPLTRDQIAAMHQSGQGWGRVYRDLREQGLVQDKNLGQAVSRYQHSLRTPTTTGTTPATTPGTTPGTTTGTAPGTTTGGTTTAASTTRHGHGHDDVYRSTGGVVTTGSGRTYDAGRHGPNRGRDGGGHDQDAARVYGDEHRGGDYARGEYERGHHGHGDYARETNYSRGSGSAAPQAPSTSTPSAHRGDSHTVVTGGSSHGGGSGSGGGGRGRH